MNKKYESDTNEANRYPNESDSARLARSVSGQSAAIQPTAGVVGQPDQVDDPKQYMQTPFPYSAKDNESVALNSGSLTYTATDFVLPGKNGMDLAVTRRYCSSSANINDVDIQLDEVNAWAFKIYHTYRLRGISYTFEVVDFDSARFGKVYLDHDSCAAAAEMERQRTEDFFVVGDYYSELGGILSYSRVTTGIQMHGKEWVYTTQSRPNEHLATMYGLGLGWSFCFPSIESVAETYRKNTRNRVRYNDFLHLGDGRVYEIDFDKTSGLKEYELEDLRLEKVTGTIPVAHNYIIHHKNGSKEYLQVANASVSQRSKLVAVQDRFGNLIRYTFHDGGGVTIVDSLGQTVTLTRSGSELKWALPGSRTVTYSVTNNQLVKVRDAIGNDTAFHYATQTVYCQPMEAFGHNRVAVSYANLDYILHPTGAKTEYTYSGMSSRTQYGTMASFVLRSRRDLPVASNTGDAYNTENYSYSFAYDNSKKRDYIATGVFTNADGLATTCTFEKDGLLTAERAVHGGATVSAKSFEYWKKLPSKEVSTVPVAKTASRTYDNKGNILTQTDAMGYTTTMTYHATYSLQTSKIWWRDGSTKLEKRNTISGDGKTITVSEMWENGTRRQGVQFEYTSTGAVSKEKELNASNQVVRETVYHYQDNRDVFVRQKVVGGLAQDILVYDAYGNVLNRTDPKGYKTTFTYDNLNRVTSETYADGTVTSKQYYIKPNYIVETDELGNQKRLNFTPLGKMQTVVLPATNTTLSSYTYDRMERVLTEIAYHTQGNATTTCSYDCWGRIKSKTTTGTGVNYQETYTYSDAAMTESKTVVGDTAAPPVVTTIVRDKLDRVVSEAVGSSTTTYTYDYVGNKLTARTTLDAARGVYSGRWSYDYANRVVTETNALGRSMRTAYDVLGNKSSTTDFAGRTTTYTYDALGRVLTRTAPFEGTAKAIVKYTYDAAGNVLKQEVLSSALGAAQKWSRTEYTYDKRHRLVDTILFEADGGENRTRTEYDKAGYKLAVYAGMQGNSTSGAHKTAYTYDRFGNMTSTTDSLGKRETLTYDDMGTLQTHTDRNGNVKRYTYDALGRVLTITARGTDGTELRTTQTYTKSGQKLSESNAQVSIHFQYDNMGRLTRQTETGGVRKDYAYDTNGSRTAFTLYRNNAVEMALAYEYDSLNQLTGVKRSGAFIAAYTYDHNSNRATLTYPASGITVNYSYNEANLVTAMTNKKGAQVISSYNCTYLLDGNQLTKRDHRGKTTTYAYDTMGRLISEKWVDRDGAAESIYEYDRFGNRTKLTESDAGDTIKTTYRYDGNNRLLSEERAGRRSTETWLYSYDAGGNQTVQTWEKVAQKGTDAPKRVTIRRLDLQDGAAILELRTYNALGQLIAVDRDGAQTAYTYRPDGLRQTKTVGGVLTTHIWDGQEIVAELAAGGNLKAKYLRGANLLAQELDGQLYYYLHNAHSDVVQRVNAQGTVLRAYDYNAFGNERERDKTDANPFRYCGEYYDAETEQIYLRARYYEPRTGRFTSEDPARDGANWYVYCDNNPLQYIDPTGLTPWAQLAKDRNPGSNFASSTRYTYLNNASSSSNRSTSSSFSANSGSTGRPWVDMALKRNPSYSLSRSVINHIYTAPGRPTYYLSTVALPWSLPWSYPAAPTAPYFPPVALPEGGEMVDPWESYNDLIVRFAKSSKQTDRQKKNDVPDWARGERPTPKDKTPKDFAKRLLDDKYGPNRWKEGPGTEYNQIKKWAEMKFW